MKEDFAVTTPTETQIVAVPLDELQPADDNMRGPVGDVSELARSIAGVGIIEPLVVVPLDGQHGRYRIDVVTGRSTRAGAIPDERPSRRAPLF